MLIVPVARKVRTILLIRAVRPSRWIESKEERYATAPENLHYRQWASRVQIQRNRAESSGNSTVEKMSRNEQTSYIFANCKGERAHIISQIERIANVESTTPVTGRFDLVIKLRTNEPSKAYTIMEKIRDIPSITNTQTAISFESIANSSNESDNESPLAFALLKVRGTFDTVLRKLKTIPNFAEAHVIPGAFDILAAFRADSHEELLEKSVEKIGSINGITASETLISYNPPERSERI